MSAPAYGRSLREELEHQRLEVRERQLERVLSILQARGRAAEGAERSGLGRAIADFGAEFEQVRAELRRAG